MARVVGLLKLRGSAGGFTFYEFEGETYCKEKGSPNEWQMKHGHQFAGARRQAAEFGRASAAGKLFRQAMGGAADGLRLHSLSSRMCTWLLGALQCDPVSDWGERKLTETDLSLLDGFEFNKKTSLDDLLPVNLNDNHRIQDDRIRVSMPGFRLRRKKKIPERATHYRIVSGLVYIDFGKRSFKRDLLHSEYHPIGNKHCAAFEVEHLLQEHAGMAGFWLWGIEYYETTAKGWKAVKGGSMRMMKCWNVQEVQQLELNRAEMAALMVQEPCFACAVEPAWVAGFSGAAEAGKEVTATEVVDQETERLSVEEMDLGVTVISAEVTERGEELPLTADVMEQEMELLSPEVLELQAELLAEFDRRVAVLAEPQPAELAVDAEGALVPDPEGVSVTAPACALWGESAAGSNAFSSIFVTTNENRSDGFSRRLNNTNATTDSWDRRQPGQPDQCRRGGSLPDLLPRIPHAVLPVHESTGAEPGGG